ncbi:acyl-CoA synthetase [Nannocystaceae bacterium ST9]
MIVGDWLGRRARLSPRAPAILDLASGGEGRWLDYASLDRATNQVAHWLITQGVERDDRVAILAKNRLEYLLLWFACGKLGAVLQALNWRLTARELEPLIAAAAPRLLMFEREFAAAFVGVRAIDLDGPEFAASLALPEHAPPPVEFGLEQPWVLCYTGGTTGQAKAAILTHGTITWNAINTVASWELSSRDIAILDAPMFHTGGLNVFTAPLIHAGGGSILCREFDVELRFALLRSHPVTCLFGVPAMFQAMQAHAEFEAAPLERLRIVISGGAPCPMPVFERFWARGIDFKTGYGLTEAGPNNFWLPRERVRDKPGAVGWPLLHVEIAIVDGEGRRCDPGEVGELWIRGPHVSPGYYGDPAATAAAFVEGWLHTGDLAFADAEGCVSVVGRRKDMIISGGENVYPAEIESAIAGHGAVVEVALIGVPDPRWGEVGRAIVVLRPGGSLTLTELHEFLADRLARYKLPKSLVIVDALPRTGAGKLDKRALVERHGG